MTFYNAPVHSIGKLNTKNWDKDYLIRKQEKKVYKDKVCQDQDWQAGNADKIEKHLYCL